MQEYLEWSFEVVAVKASGESGDETKYQDTIREIAALMSEMQVISTPAVHKAAKAWFNAVCDVSQVGEGDSLAWSDALDKVRSAHNDFASKAQSELLGNS
jgi:hypothetical protein